MLMHCRYKDDNNEVDSLHVEHLVNDEWQTLDLNIYSPGFDVFLYAILTCQHMYFKNNAAEFGLILDSSEGLVTLIADSHRNIKTLDVEFKGKLKKGDITEEAVTTITARMKLCPVSINLREIPHTTVKASFELN